MENIISIEFGKTIETASDSEKYYAVSKAIILIITKTWVASEETQAKARRVFYMSAEFLMGRALGNNLLNLCMDTEIRAYLTEMGIDYNRLEALEEDAGLGNGGLGRLAACFIDSCATMDLPVVGCGLRYKYGLFKQVFENGFQKELPDHWMKNGDPWSIRREQDAVTVQFGDLKVRAVPYDTPVIGYGSKTINRLRLWQSEPIEEFNLDLFNAQEYDHSLTEKNRAEDISRVLYPCDDKLAGKQLRIKQQYFFVSASIQDMVRHYKRTFGEDFTRFGDYHMIQLNDTHPVVAIPELMRILMDEESLTWEAALGIARQCFAYTNHTILSEALEQWECQLFAGVLPRIYEIIQGLDAQLVAEFRGMGLPEDKIAELRVINHNRIRMAWLAIGFSTAVNGVAALHTEILKTRELRSWFEIYPDKFQNKTNGITPRRWLALCNPELSALITSLLGSDAWVTDLGRLKALEQYADNAAVLEALNTVKHQKKQELADYILAHEGIVIDPNSIFDIQIKRLHEYKRQLMNALHIVDLYYRLKADPSLDFHPVTFIFGAKSAPGYFRAKAVIKFINEIARKINADPEVNAKLKVVFIQNYKVSYAEKLVPAADVSEQISTAGKEASGTGNMKLMLNGAVTLGTLDGANVEIVEEAGHENNFIFGATVEELEALRDHYSPRHFYETVPGLHKALDSLIDSTFDDGNTFMFFELYKSLLDGHGGWNTADPYYVLKDFAAYRDAQARVNAAYKDRLGWARMCLINIANAGKFSSDRTISEYARDIWRIRSLTASGYMDAIENSTWAFGDEAR